MRAGCILFYPRLFEAYESGGNGVDGEAGDGVDVEFSQNILAVGEHRVERDEEPFGDLLVDHAAHHAAHDVALALRKQVGRARARSSRSWSTPCPPTAKCSFSTDVFSPWQSIQASLNSAHLA